MTQVTSLEVARPHFNTDGPTKAVPGDLGTGIRDLNANDDGDGEEKGDGGGGKIALSGSFDFGSSDPSDGDAGMITTDSPQNVREKYSVEPDEIGCGEYGIVRMCRDRRTGEPFAIKSIPKSKVEGKARGKKISKIEAIKREAEILKDVQHPRIIRLFDVYEDATYLHLITELCTGGMLFDRVVKKLNPFTEKEAAGLVKSVLEAIAYLHDVKNIVHRDIKCENVLFETKHDDSPVKLIDFGMSRLDPLSHPMETSIGTAYYVAPEVIEKKYTKACDMWSLGVVAYMTLAGYYPFWGDSTAKILRHVKSGEFDFPVGEWAGVSCHGKDFVCCLLQTDPAERLTATKALEHKWIVKHTADKKKKKSRGRSILKSLKSASRGRSKSRGKSR